MTLQNMIFDSTKVKNGMYRKHDTKVTLSRFGTV